MFKKVMILLNMVLVLTFISCGSSNSSNEAKELMTKLLNFVGIPTDIVVAVCIDKDRNGICASTEVQAKVTLHKGDSFDDIWEKLTLNEDGKYLLEVYDEKLPILITIKDEEKIDYDNGKFTLAFGGFKTKDNNETKEISILQSMIDADVIKSTVADKFRTLKNSEAQNKYYKTLLSDLESNINTLRAKGLNSKTAVLATVKEMADETKTNEEQATRINSCESDQVCIDREIKTLSDELIITDEESKDIVDLKFTKEYIVGKTLYMVRAETNSYFTVKYDRVYGKREIGTEGDMKSQEYIIDDNGDIVVGSSDVIIKLIARYEKYDHIQVSLPKLNRVYENQRAYFNENDAKEYFLSINNSDDEVQQFEKWLTPLQSDCESNGGDYNSTQNNQCNASWEESKNICTTIGGKLPNLATLQSVVTDCGGSTEPLSHNDENTAYQDCYQEKGFIGLDNNYWSSITNKDADYDALIINFNTGYEYSTLKTSDNFVRCIL